jgi:hypothetical protein
MEGGEGGRASWSEMEEGEGGKASWSEMEEGEGERSIVPDGGRGREKG